VIWIPDVVLAIILLWQWFIYRSYGYCN